MAPLQKKRKSKLIYQQALWRMLSFTRTTSSSFWKIVGGVNANRLIHHLQAESHWNCRFSLFICVCVCVCPCWPHLCLSCAVGGLAVEKLGKLLAWGSWRGDADSEKAPTEHAHLGPGPAKEHEVEAPGPSGRQILPPKTLRPSTTSSLS